MTSYLPTDNQNDQGSEQSYDQLSDLPTDRLIIDLLTNQPIYLPSDEPNGQMNDPSAV